MGVYGGFVTCFPELYETMSAWAGDGKPYKFRGLYIPENGVQLSRLKDSIDIAGYDALYIEEKHSPYLKVGMFFKRGDATAVMKIAQDVGYNVAGDFHVYLVQKVTGVNPEQTAILRLNEARWE